MIKNNLKNIVLIFSILLVFSLGYYFRAYYDLNTFLAGSPYEIYSVEVSAGADSNSSIDSSAVENFSDKVSRYPFSYYLNSIIPEFLSNIYIVYILFSILIFYFAKLLTRSNLGGLVALTGFALTGENLINYTRYINTSGLSYLLILASLFTFYKFIKTNEKHYLFLLILFGVLNTVTYHTGGTALFVIMSSILFFRLFKFNFDQKIPVAFLKEKKEVLFSLVIILGFYIFYILKNDLHQFDLIKGAMTSIFSFKILLLVILFSVFIFLVRKYQNVIKNNFKWILYFSVFVSVFIYFRNGYFIDLISLLNIDFYYISYLTFNNYLIQIILTHVYILYFLPDILFSNKSKFNFLRGWFFGLVIIFIGLIIQGYYLRILDYSFIFSYLLMSMYWLENINFRKTIIFGSFILIILSQFSIFHDPFSMRRYYNQDEYLSAQKVAELNLDGFVISDLRVSAILSRFNYDNVYFDNGGNPLHNVLFYYPNLIGDTGADYLILSENMKNIVYSRDFPTKPITQDLVDYYQSNYDLIYDDGIFYVYNLNK